MSPTRTALRILGVIGCVAAMCVFAAPADAHHDVEFETYSCSKASTPDVEPDLTPPPTEPPANGDQPPVDEEPTPAPQNCMPAEGERIWGTRLVRFSASTDDARPLRRVALYILSEEESIPHAGNGEPLLEEEYTRNEDVTSYDTPFSWNSNEVTPFNGIYKIRVEVDTYQPFSNETHNATAERRDLHVDNPPRAVAAPRIVATTPSSVTMNWDQALESDVLSYTVYRATTKTATRPPYSALQQIGVTTGPAFRDTKISPDVHWYAVKVTRRSSVTPDTGISSQLSQMSGPADVKILVEAAKKSDKKPATRRPIACQNCAPRPVTSRLAAVADAPFAYKLPYDPDSAVPSSVIGSSSEGGADPRGPVLPVAVGMFLVSSALAVGRMPY